MAESLPLPDDGGQEKGELDNQTSEKLGEVTAIFDMDGYTVDGVFKCKELGWKYLNHPTAYSFFFHHGNLHNLSAKDRFSANYIYQNVFDIGYGEYWPGMLKGCEVERMVDRLHGQGRVAFKGGHYERDMLTELRIPFLNLEDVGCPKVDKLLEDCPFSYPTCGHHRKEKCHCPREEVSVMEWWLNRVLWNGSITTKVSPIIKNPFVFLMGTDFAFI